MMMMMMKTTTTTTIPIAVFISLSFCRHDTAILHSPILFGESRTTHVGAILQTKPPYLGCESANVVCIIHHHRSIFTHPKCWYLFCHCPCNLCVCVLVCLCSIIVVNVVGCSAGLAVTTGLKQPTASMWISLLLVSCSHAIFFTYLIYSFYCAMLAQSAVMRQ